jgi:ABC-type transporter Mla maintaining outer membrane lipid asymmetry ATPase subunit MlaF
MEPVRSSPVARSQRLVALSSRAGGLEVELTLELDRGHRYRILAEGPLRASLCSQLSSKGLAAVVSPDGGLIGNLRVWENITLPLEWHGARRDDLWDRVRAILHQLGFTDDQAARLCQAMPDALSAFEARAALFTRGLLVSPELLVFDRLFVGLGRRDSERAATFQSVLEATLPSRTSVYLEEDDPPFASVPETHRHDFRDLA